MRVEWIETKGLGEIRARRADKKARHSNTRFGRTTPARLPPGEPGYVSLEGIDIVVVQAQIVV